MVLSWDGHAAYVCARLLLDSTASYHGLQLRRRLVILHCTCAQEERSKIQISGIEIVYSNRNFWSPTSAVLVSCTNVHGK
jgi:hypothetical protein